MIHKLKHLYRYEGAIQWKDDCTYQEVIELQEFLVLRKTPKGFWIQIKHWSGKVTEKWVQECNYNGKRFAYEKKEDALNSFIIRKARRTNHLRRQLEMTQRTYEFAKGSVDFILSRKENKIVTHTETVASY